MPLKLTVGVSRKVGQPDYGSLGASCGIELELDATLLRSDPDAFHRAVRDAYAACEQAVHDELARQTAGSTRATATGRCAQTNGHSIHGPSNRINGRSNGAPAASEKPATAKQIRAIRSMAERHNVDLLELLANRFRVAALEELTVRNASRLIDELQAGSD